MKTQHQLWFVVGVVVFLAGWVALVNGYSVGEPLMVASAVIGIVLAASGGCDGGYGDGGYDGR